MFVVHRGRVFCELRLIRVILPPSSFAALATPLRKLFRSLVRALRVKAFLP